jgi:queuine tRNA-ribosyltransferase
VAHGVDMMDCVLPSRNARHGKLFTSTGSFSIKNAKFKADPAPADPACSCYTCRNFSRAYLRHLFLAGEPLFVTLATLHNLRRYLDIMREMREAIIDKSFPKYLKSVRASAPAERDAVGGTTPD